MNGLVMKSGDSVIVENDFIRSGELSLSEKAMYIILAGYCKAGEYECSPSIRSELVPSTGVRAKTIINTISKLVEKGYIRKEVRVDELGGRLSNKYIIIHKPRYDSEFLRICMALEKGKDNNYEIYDRALNSLLGYIKKVLPKHDICINGENYDVKSKYFTLGMDICTTVEGRDRDILWDIFNMLEDIGIIVFVRELTKPPYIE